MITFYTTTSNFKGAYIILQNYKYSCFIMCEFCNLENV